MICKMLKYMENLVSVVMEIDLCGPKNNRIFWAETIACCKSP